MCYRHLPLIILSIATIVILTAAGSILWQFLKHAPIELPQINDKNVYSARAEITFMDFGGSKSRVDVQYEFTSDLISKLSDIGKDYRQYPVVLGINLPGLPHGESGHATAPKQPSGPTQDITITATPLYGETLEYGKHGIHDIPFVGNSQCFPYDSYSASIGLYAQSTPNMDFEKAEYPSQTDWVPFVIIPYQNFSGYVITPISQENNNVVQISIRRPLYAQLLPVSYVLLLILIGLFVIKPQQRAEHLPFSIVALIIAIPATRAAVVPADIGIPCAFDMMLLIPFLMLLIGLFRFILGR